MKLKMKNNLKKQRGITLISLAITILVLIILASVATYSGKSVISSSKLTAFTTEMKIMQSEVNNLYERKKSGEDVSSYGVSVESASSEVQEQANKVFTSSASGITDYSGYKYFSQETIKSLDIEGVEQEVFVNIDKRSVVSYQGFRYEGNIYYTLEQLPNGLYNVEYQEQTGGPTFDVSNEYISSDNYRVTISNIQYEGNISKWQVQYRLEGQEHWNTSDDLSFNVSKMGKYYVKILNGTIESETIEIDMGWNEAKGVNSPKISEGMIPVKYNTSNGKWVICSSTDLDWYSYTQEDKKWANVMLCDGTYNESTPVGTVVEESDLGSMFVWIPRYAYTISSGYHSTSGSIDIVWLRGTSYNYVDSNGNTCTARNGNESGVTTNNAGYYVAHPAFTNGNTYGTFDNGEWKSEITGIWVAKFQAGFATTDNDTTQKVTIASSDNSSTTATSVYYPIFKGRKYAYNYVSVSQCYDLSQALDDSGNPYGLSTSSNSHLMKNSEWGAVAYLSISKYGYSDGSGSKEKAKNNLSVDGKVDNLNNSGWKIYGITGYSAPDEKTDENIMTYSTATDLVDIITGTNGKSYAWNNVSSGNDTGDGTKSSTTGNIYGIYDMGGCLADYTASYINAVEDENLTTYGGRFASGTSTYLATAYPYQTDSSITYSTDYKDFNSAYPGFGKIFGDAIWETSSGTGNGNAWFGQTLEEDGLISELFFLRGENWYSTNTVGLYGLYDGKGDAYYYFGFHSVLAVE